MVAAEQQVTLAPYYSLSEQGSPAMLPLSSSTLVADSPSPGSAAPLAHVPTGCEDGRQRAQRHGQRRQQHASPGAVLPYPTRRQSRLARPSTNGAAEEVPDLVHVFGLLSQLQAAESQASSVSATVEELTHNAFCLACTVLGASVGVITGLWTGVSESLPSFRGTHTTRR
eukprot:jgi/Tetstr1/459238/TSEL_000047.t1